MARWIGPNRDISNVLAAAEAWRDRCFLGGASMFGDEPLWTLENVRRVRELCQTEKQETDEQAWARFTGQLTDATPEAVRAAAEAVWLAYLFPTVPDSGYKRRRFTELWELSGAEWPDSAHLTESALQGIGTVPARALANQQPSTLPAADGGTLGRTAIQDAAGRAVGFHRLAG